MPLRFSNSTFIHIPKNAGNSLEQWAIKNNLVYEDKENHCTLKTARGLWHDLGTVFSFVRNPFSRTVSIYHYLGQHAEQRILENRSSDILDDLKTVKLYKRGFDYWLNCLHDTNSGFNEKSEITNINGISTWPRRASQLHWFDDGMPDIIIKIEELDSKFNVIKELLNVTSDIPLGWVNASKHDDYRAYYNKQNIQLVETMFGNDLETFGYNF